MGHLTQLVYESAPALSLITYWPSALSLKARLAVCWSLHRSSDEALGHHGAVLPAATEDMRVTETWTSAGTPAERDSESTSGEAC